MSESLTAVLDSLGIQALSHPEWLWILIPSAGVAWIVMAAGRAPALAWPNVGEARRAGARGLDPVRGIGLGLRGVCLLILALVLAGPVGVHRAPPEPGHGLDMTLVLDASGSMRALDAMIDGSWHTRLDLARSVVARFAEHRAADGDRVALVVFGDSAFTQCPLTSDGSLLASALGRVEAGMAGEATALGDALSLAVKRALAGNAASAAAAGPVAGRLVVLLTDGRHNAGRLSVEVATALARASGVRVHTVAIGSSGGDVAIERGDGGALRFERHDVDAEKLEGVALATGGRFFRARRPADLEQVYAEIDRLERIVRSLPPRIRHTERAEPLLAAAGGLLLAELGLVRIWRRRLP